MKNQLEKKKLQALSLDCKYYQLAMSFMKIFT